MTLPFVPQDALCLFLSEVAVAVGGRSIAQSRAHAHATHAFPMTLRWPQYSEKFQWNEGMNKQIKIIGMFHLMVKEVNCEPGP